MSDTPTAVRQFRFHPPPGACDLILVRHGESEPAVEGQLFPNVDGHSDPPLHAQGHDEAKRVAQRLRGEEISAIYTTPLTRTKQTAAPLAAALGIEPKVEHDLREVFLGEWEGGEYRRRARDRDPLFLKALQEQEWGIVPGAETNAQLGDRVRVGIERIAAAHADQRVVAVVHGGVISMVLHLATACRPLSFIAAENGSLTHLVIVGDRWIVRRFNDTGHLATDLDKPLQPLV